MKLQLVQLRLEADDIVSLVLRDPSGTELPTWSAGSHVPVTLPSGLVRQYSLCGPQDDRHTYTVAVLRVDRGRGGSREIHDRLRVGDIVEVGQPRNDFGLVPAEHYLFTAGGIGITPILAMLDEVSVRNPPPASVRVVYGARSRSAMAFVERLRRLDDIDLQLVAQDTDGLPDFAAAIAASPPGTQMYSCGPPAMLSAVTQLGQERPDISVHIERFSGAEQASSVSDGEADDFEVELVRTGITVKVSNDRSVLDAVLEAAPDTPFSCTSGFCGTCETKVLGGEVDHRDELLTDAERAANQTMMICVSRAKAGSRLRLDL
ncbi:PDR/VanB family oxidoreductase [[Mycobacterium] wendilense]|uniref:PDR/VanB family oxidoreductase n=1 Tax=[Mycobacterium] wendilense TaxID=3064284 RepID=A0ABN9P6T8_9MYCO|nr:PDR/VanB family oxidoreductase [Mycolicibacterium sp. MU0050]CAJ1585886.1 PDR/VanB family oxidoreductase [Mycolicibacterium sp. MU0050]